MNAAFDERFEREAVDNLYWDNDQGSWYTDRWDIPNRDGDCNFYYGRCRSGHSWFWRVYGWAWGHEKTGEDYHSDYGWSDTEEQAFLEGTAAIKHFAVGRRTIVQTRHGYASDKLKELNKAKRVKRWTDAPANGSNTHAIEYLYYRYGSQYRITKKTAQRIYYIKDDHTPDEIGFAPRRRVADDWPGLTWRDLYELEDKLGYRNAPRFFLKPCPYPDRDQPPKIDIHALKAAMAAAHPDRGGSNAEFIAARKAYVAAKEAVKARA